MAGIAITIGSVASLLTPYLPQLINIAEAVLNKPKAGATRKQAVLQAARGLLDGIFALNPPSTPLTPNQPTLQPTDAELGGLIEAILAQMKAQGTLVQPGGSPTSSPTLQTLATDIMYLIQGGSVTALQKVAPK